MTRSADLNTALVAYLGYKRADVPQSDWLAVVESLGIARAEAVEWALLDVLYQLREIKPDWRAHSLWSGSEWAVRELRKRYPDLDDEATKTLTWAFSCEQELTVGPALSSAAQKLGGVSDTPRLDAELLMAHALGVERGALLLDPTRFAVPDGFAALVERRLAHEPVAYIVGHRDFWTIGLKVGPGALIPRPDSETLIEAAVAHFGAAGPRRVLDLGTGPGTLLLAGLAEWPKATGLGIDASEAALAYARANAEALGLADRSGFQPGNWAVGVDGTFDLILCNPPYIADDEALMPDVVQYEPGGALFSGPDGLDDYRHIIPDLPRLLAPGGVAILEIGATQHMLVRQLAEAVGFAVACTRDLGGRDRALTLTRA